MKTALILHGKPSRDEYFDPGSPSPSNAHWLPWIQRQLILNGVLAQTPEMPEPYAPNYEAWSALFQRFAIDAGTMLVGHSCGAGFLVRWLSEHPVAVGKVALVAPWADPSQTRARAMFDGLRIDAELAGRTEGVQVFISGDDGQEIHQTVALLESSIKRIGVRRFDGRGHFTLRDMGTQEFPELKDFLLG
jgi:predicted alpha/beta hydrolase family esterase